jgi:hypothetical protein
VNAVFYLYIKKLNPSYENCYFPFDVNLPIDFF